MASLEQMTIAQIKGLTPAERLEAANMLWESLSDVQKQSQMTTEEQQLLDYSLNYSAEHPEESVPWDQLKRELDDRLP